jgi:hypothetical protein
MPTCADGGGGLDLLPAELIDPDALVVSVSYLTPQGVLVSPVLEPLSCGLADVMAYTLDIDPAAVTHLPWNPPRYGRIRLAVWRRR